MDRAVQPSSRCPVEPCAIGCEYVIIRQYTETLELLYRELDLHVKWKNAYPSL